MSILEDMYYGDLLPFGELSINTPEYEDAMKELCDAESELLVRFPECKPLIEKYQRAQMKVNSIALCDHFKTGFKAGVQILLEAISLIK